MEIDMDRIKQVIEQMASVLDHTRGIVRRDGGPMVRLRTNGRSVEMPPLLMGVGFAVLLLAGLFFTGREPHMGMPEDVMRDSVRLQPAER